jgi:hypothetical protein
MSVLSDEDLDKVAGGIGGTYLADKYCDLVDPDRQAITSLEFRRFATSDNRTVS